MITESTVTIIGDTHFGDYMFIKATLTVNGNSKWLVVDFFKDSQTIAGFYEVDVPSHINTAEEALVEVKKQEYDIRGYSEMFI